ncbi:lysozyme [Pseudomonas sp. S37]|nr:lysozyme [Pseudomonas sp. S37]
MPLNWRIALLAVAVGLYAGGEGPGCGRPASTESNWLSRLQVMSSNWRTVIGLTVENVRRLQLRP